MYSDKFNFTSTDEVKGWGEGGKEVLAAPMGDMASDRNVLGRIIEPETCLVTLTEVEPSNGHITSELEQLLPVFSRARRNVIKFPLLSVGALIEDDDTLRSLLLDKYPVHRDLINNMSFGALRWDIAKTVERLQDAIDYTHDSLFRLVHVAPEQRGAVWHQDGGPMGTVRGLRNLSVAGMDAVLREHFTMSGKKYNVEKFGSVGLGLSTMYKSPEDGCPPHRTSASNAMEHRWGYTLDAPQRR